MIPPKEFIRKIRPFSFLTEEELDILVSGLEAALYRKDHFLYRTGETRRYIYIVVSGLVCLLDEGPVDYVSREEILGIITSDANSFLVSAQAVEDTVCYLISRDKYKEVFERNRAFSAFFTAIITKRFRSFRTAVSDGKILQESSLVIDVERIIYKRPVICNPHTPVMAAAAEMDKQNVSSIVVVDENSKPVGILTRKDLVTVLMRGGQSSLVSEFMSFPVETISSGATVFEAFAKLTEKGFDHLVVMKGDDLLGVITRKDIQIHFEPSFSIFSLYRKVVKAGSLNELRSIVDSIRVSLAKIALAGSDFFDLTKTISSVHDAIVVRTLEFLADSCPDREFVWVNMGSSGRKEEVIATDQDNALIYRGARPTEFAEKACDSLETIGIPKCTGDYMACNETWNQSALVWKDFFRRWFADPIPFHVRYLSVFLDMRPLYGDSSIYDEIVECIGRSVTQEAITSLVSDAVEVEPSLDTFGIMGLRKRLDLKMHGIYPIVNGIRALALYGGLHKLTNTRERMEKLCLEGIIDEMMRHDLVESYGFLQDLRLRHHAEAVLSGNRIDNIVHAKELSKVDLLILKESLKVVASFRKFLMRKFDLTQPMALREL